LIAEHINNRADVTVATLPVARKEVPAFGIMQMDAERRIVRFVEKPKDPAVQDSLRLPRNLYGPLGIEGDKEMFLASMGIYVFNRKSLLELLENTQTDFGKHIIPGAIPTHRIFGYVFQGYWEDIGTIRAFFEANLGMTKANPQFNFFDLSSPVFTHPRFLPSSRIDGGVIEGSLVADGSLLDHAQIRDSLVGVRSQIHAGSKLRRVVMMGADYFETEEAVQKCVSKRIPPIGIGRNTIIENAIIDKNARIGDNCAISPDGKPAEMDNEFFYIRDGVVIIPKNAVVPHGMVI
jgi:glucose-1-phosphate adenylyltransferase